MARVTVEDAVDQIGNRFDLILVASRRARQLAMQGKEAMVPWKSEKATVIALREIEQGFITAASLDQDEQQTSRRQDADDLAAVDALRGLE